MYPLIFFTIFCFCTYVAFTRVFSYWNKRGIPHPPFSILFGNLTAALIFKKSLGQIYDKIYNAYPDLPYVGFYKIRTPAILLRDPELIKEVLIKSFNHFQENDVFQIDKTHEIMIAKNPFFSAGDEWKASRGQVTPSLTINKVKNIFPLIDSVCQKFVKHLESPLVANGGTDVKILCQRYTMDVVALSVLGLEADSFVQSNTEYMKNVLSIVAPGILLHLKVTIIMLLPFISKLFNLNLIPDHAATYFKNIISKTISYRKENNIERKDFLNSMQKLQVKLGKERFTDDDITAHAVSFFLDGFETSSIVMSFALYELGANIDVQEKLRKEIARILETEKKLTFESIQEMTYLNKCINETLRMHPPALFLGKRCTKSYHLPLIDKNSKELLVEPDTPIIIPIYSLHNDVKYFPNPHKFDPERFTNEENLTKFSFLPFGEGPRICVGRNFAMMQVKAAIVNLVLNYDIRVNSKTITPLEMDPTYFMLAAKGGIWLNFIKRKINK